MKRKVRSIVGTVAALGAVIAAVVLLLGGGASRQFSGLRCDVEKPEGDYENAAAVADYTDLMPIQTGAFIFENGATVDIWAADPDYWGGEDYVPGSGEPSTVYALSGGEILLEVYHRYTGYNLNLMDEDAVAASRAFIEAHPVFDLGRQLSAAYNRLRSAIESGASFEFQTIEQRDELRKPINRRWSVRGIAEIGTRGKYDLKELASWYYTFDPETGEFIGAKMRGWD